MDSFYLDKIIKGQTVIVIKLPAGNLQAQLIRMGISEGQFIKCLERLPGGTIVIQKNRQEIAIGFKLASTILVERINNEK